MFKHEIESFRRELYGSDARPGISTSVALLSQKMSIFDKNMDDIKLDISSINSDVKVLLRFNIQQQAMAEAEAERKKKMSNKVKTIIAIASVVGTGITILISIL
jgi:hypothetical protein